jgi:hypothetical protein
MKNFLIIVLILVAVGYYFDISPTDFFPTVPNSPAARERHASAPAANQAPAQSAQPSPATTPAASVDAGSLANRWKPYTSASPNKP